MFDYSSKADERCAGHAISRCRVELFEVIRAEPTGEGGSGMCFRLKNETMLSVS